jgi:hypothetical protein
MIEANGRMKRMKLLLVEVSNKRDINSVPCMHECRLIFNIRIPLCVIVDVLRGLLKSFTLFPSSPGWCSQVPASL